MRLFIRMFFVLVFMVTAAPLHAEEQNDCHDREAALTWEKMVKETPNDLALQRLHALRLGICSKIDAGSLTFDQGMSIFEEARENAVQKRFEEGRVKKKALKQ